jgi:maltooligosyltrehalose trehalohydrolase
VIIPRLHELKELGVNAIELMPVAQFPGERNWGYDGVYPFAVQSSYGGPEGLKQLVNECHKQKIAVILDVVYNHLGPEGNYLEDFGPYFTEKYRTPWGKALNFDGPYSNEVRNYFIENALYWFDRYHIDALRIDAIHGICDMSAKHFLQELAENVEKGSGNGRKRQCLIAESDLNDVRVIKSRKKGGFGIDAQWCDDFHHALHTLLTHEDQGYYQDFGTIKNLATSLKEGYVFSGQYSSYRKRNHGNSSADRPANQFIVFSQNHDQIGNRVLGDRLSNLVSFEALKLAAGTVLVSPYIPLLFMGEEYGEESPFLYFVSHSDPALVKAVREGRRSEFKAFYWQDNPPDPQDPATYLQCKLDWEKRSKGKHKILLNFYCTLIKLRKTIPALRHLRKNMLEVSISEKDKMIAVLRWHENNQVLCIMNFNIKNGHFTATNLPDGSWRKVLDSSDKRWNGPGATTPDSCGSFNSFLIEPYTIVLYQREEKL